MEKNEIYFQKLERALKKNGKILMGIHYDYKSKRGERAVLKQAKREARLAARRAKRKNITVEASSESVMHDIQKPITLEDLTSPNNKK